jgi:hypothetical protein
MTLYRGTSALINSTLHAILGDDEPRPCSLNLEASCGKIIVALSNLLHPNIDLSRIHKVRDEADFESFLLSHLRPGR